MTSSFVPSRHVAKLYTVAVAVETFGDLTVGPMMWGAWTAGLGIGGGGMGMPWFVAAGIFAGGLGVSDLATEVV